MLITHPHISSLSIQFLLATSLTITASHQYYLNVVQALFKAGKIFAGGLVTINDVLSRWRAFEEEMRSRERVLSQLFPG